MRIFSLNSPQGSGHFDWGLMIYFREVAVGRLGGTLDGEVVWKPSGRFGWNAGFPLTASQRIVSGFFRKADILNILKERRYE